MTQFVTLDFYSSGKTTIFNRKPFFREIEGIDEKIVSVF